MKRKVLMAKGLYPETLPPCFDSEDINRAIHGSLADLRDNQFKNGRASDYIRYVGTKHDGNRRHYGTPNPIPYFSVCSFIESNSTTFEGKYQKSSFSLSTPRPGTASDDRAIIVSSLSELSQNLSKKIRYAPFLLKTDIAQFFPSVYTHAIPWVEHGRDASKNDRKKDSVLTRFNRLDWFTQQCQNGQTRGVLVGPDAFRIIAEFLASEIDRQLIERTGEHIVGGVRHVDDFYIGVRSEIDATIVLSHLRDILQSFELQINDSKTKIISGLEPVNDVWAQDLRAFNIAFWGGNEAASRLIDKAYETAREVASESPIKLVLRRLDQTHCYRGDVWREIEPKLQRMLHHYPHCVDYVCLLVAKRKAIGGDIDSAGWAEAAALLIKRHLSFNHHHELCWLLWLTFVCELPCGKDLIEEVSKVRNSHVAALLVAAYSEGRCAWRPKITFGNRLSTTDEHWLHNLVARASGFTSASFGGGLMTEFEYLASKQVKMLVFDRHMKKVARQASQAISRSKYGYDVEDEIEFDEEIEF